MVLYVNDVNFMVVLNVSKEKKRNIKQLIYYILKIFKFYTLIYQIKSLKKKYFTAIYFSLRQSENSENFSRA